MYTQCPGCKTIYSISIAQLKAGRGEALCQGCHRVFNALDALADAADDAVSDGPRPANPPVLGPGDAVPASGADQRVWKEVADPELPRLSAQPGDASGRYDSWNEDSEMQPSSPVTRAAWWLGALALLAVLLGQVGVFEGARLAQNESLRPWLDIACEVLHCSLPAFRDIGQIQILDKTLQPAAGGVDGLEFSLVLANQARLPQAFPDIRLVLTDFNNAPVAARIFRPEEYLSEPSTGLMPVGKPFEIHLLLAKPGREVAGFQFELI